VSVIVRRWGGREFHAVLKPSTEATLADLSSCTACVRRSQMSQPNEIFGDVSTPARSWVPFCRQLVVGDAKSDV